MAMSEVDYLNLGAKELVYSAVNMHYYNNANYNFTGIDSSKIPPSSVKVIPYSAGVSEFTNPLVSFLHTSSHTFTITYHADCKLYNASGVLVGTKTAGTETNNATYDIGDGSRNIWFVPA